VTSTITSPRSPMFKAVEAVVPPRRYDPRMLQQLLEEAGFTRGPQSFYQEPGGEPFRVEYATDGGPTPERENAIYVDSLRQSGVDVFTYVIPVAQLRDLQARALRPGLTMGGFGGKALSLFTSAEIPRPENRWAGQNRAGWSSPEYDRVWQAFDTSLDPADRERYTAQMERLISEDTGAIPTMFTVVVNARAGNLQAWRVRQTPDAAGSALNTHLWEWTR
jgi:peptide/nickel transport system substrate-binding protein